MENFDEIKKSFLISVIYVGLATVTVLSVYPSSPLYGDWVILSALLTLPVNFLSHAIMYGDPNDKKLVLIIQGLYFLAFWVFLYRYLVKKSRKK